LSPPDASYEGDIIDAAVVKGADGAYYRWCLYTAPEAFDRSADDWVLGDREVEVSASVYANGDAGGVLVAEGVRDLVLERPPVVLVHAFGRAFDKSVWEDRAPGFRFFRPFYDGRDGVFESAHGLRGLRSYINGDVRYENYERRGIVCEKVDIVAYSTGGVVARKALAIPGNERRCRRLITLAAPHWGSDLANVLMAFLCAGVGTDEERNEVYEVIRDTWGAALDDVQEGSPIIEALGESRALGHAIVAQSGGFERRVRLGLWKLRRIFEDVPPKSITGVTEPLLTKMRAVLNQEWDPFSLNALFDQESHDGVVQRCSQTGGNFSTPFAVGHLSLPQKAEAVDRVLNLLRVAEPGSVLGSFPPPAVRGCGPKNEVFDCYSAWPDSNARTEELLDVVVEPSVIRKGQPVRITAHPRSGFTPILVELGLPSCEPATFTAPPYEYTCLIPDEFDEGTAMSVYAYAKDSAGRRTFPDARVAVLPPGEARQVSALPQELTASPGEAYPLQVTAYFDGGSAADVSDALFGTSYVSRDENVAVGTANGIWAVSPGETEVVVHYGALVDTLTVRVSSTSGACLWEGGGCSVVTDGHACDGTFQGIGSICDQTPVDIESFSVERLGRVVLVRWGSPSATGQRGFHIHRAEPGRAKARITTTPLSGQRDYEFRDATAPRSALSYWLEEIGLSGASVWYGPVDLDAAPAVTPTSGVLSVRPNPSSSSATVSYQLEARGNALVTVHDVIGRLVREHRAGTLEAGRASWAWDGKNAADETVAPGTYFVRLSVDGIETATVKLILGD